MRAHLVFILAIILCIPAIGQVKIHSHNDYAHAQPFWEAYHQQAYSIEADVYVVGDSLMVAHNRKDITAGHSLEQMYLKPIAGLFAGNDHHVSADKQYTFQLMIDFKDTWDLVYPLLVKTLQPYLDCFDPKRNGKAVSIVISGNRLPDSAFHTLPSFIRLDGLPFRNYVSRDLRKVAMISDNFKTYSKWKGVGMLPEADKQKLNEVIENAHRQHKLVRFWGAPDTEATWRQLYELGADIINTDKVASCRQFFNKQK
ncbi:glycerophosphodiester phosphodiesterase [Pedobacter sp. BS3]|uniref:phosphatidylinositol-specific phospholipase C/glycerophosphodiester phosphodiesterase family protein n=1 Tax=Pedobacter sp. BS3 TaxID=2567937 RepID=UPI0011F034DF|nr:phosphatidylinositol-specific phospholipase C/glycerophosphodiester phosphodiesterase family protein [Pedobacter sp. BS3]TZF84936.1 glycerophosphodiester phosphodiesterase [Pedobacter sp. BS3]